MKLPETVLTPTTARIAINVTVVKEREPILPFFFPDIVSVFSTGQTFTHSLQFRHSAVFTSSATATSIFTGHAFEHSLQFIQVSEFRLTLKKPIFPTIPRKAPIGQRYLQKKAVIEK